MKKLLLSALVVVSSLVVAGCSHSSMTPVKGPDGREWIAISCTHGAKNCWQAAGDFCPLGYEMADEVQSTKHGPLPFSRQDRDEILVHCKAPAAPPPETAALTPRHEALPERE